MRTRVNHASPDRLARLTSAWTALPAKPWRWPRPDQILWSRGGLLAWTMANDLPDSQVIGASTYSVFVGTRSNRTLPVSVTPTSSGTGIRVTNRNAGPTAGAYLSSNDAVFTVLRCRIGVDWLSSRLEGRLRVKVLSILYSGVPTVTRAVIRRVIRCDVSFVANSLAGEGQTFSYRSE